MDEKRSEMMKKYWRRIRLMNYALIYRTNLIRDHNSIKRVISAR